jgi:uncharacterized protein YjdB
VIETHKYFFEGAKSMNRVKVIAACCALTALIITACPGPTDPDKDPGKPLTGLVVKQNGVELTGNIDIALNSTATLTADVTPADTTQPKTLTWTSSATAIATVNNGVISGVAAGTATITVKTEGKDKDGKQISKPITVNVTAPVLVQSLAIMNGAADVSGETVQLMMGNTLTLSANVSPSNTTAEDRVVSWSSGTPTVATVNASTGEVTPVAAGSTVITATTAGNTSAGSPASATVTIEVTAGPELVLFYQGESASAPVGVTTTLPAIDSSGRYIINNKNSTAEFPSANPPTTMTENVVVYLNTPLSGAFSMTARVKVKSFGDTTGDSAWEGIFIGALVNPDSTDMTAKPFRFVGARAVRSNDNRMLASRGNDSGGTPQTTSGTSFQTDFPTGFKDSSFEYVYAISRDEGGSYTIQVKNPKTEAVMASGTRSNAGTTAQYHADLAGAVYPGFLLTDCEAEISGIEIKQGTNTVFQSAPAGTYTPVNATAIDLSLEDANPESGFDDIRVLTDVPAEGLQLKTVLTPLNATDDLAWSVTGTNVTISQTGLFNATDAGEFTVTASSQTTQTVYDEFKFKILAEVPVVTGVTISGPDPLEVNVGFNITLTAAVAPVGADTAVDWSIVSGSDYATIDSGTGVLTGEAAGTVTVKATSYNGAGSSSIDSNTLSITVKQAENVLLNWTAQAGQSLTFTTPVYMNADGTVASEKSPSTITWIARDSGSNFTFDGQGGFSFTGRRFNIGTVCTDSNSNGATQLATTSSLNVSDGEFDFSVKKAKVTVTYSSASGTTPQLLLYVNNNTTGGANSPLGTASKLANKDLETTGGSVEWEIDPAAFAENAGKDSLQNAFIQIRTESNKSITITGISIQYVD